MSQRPRPFWTWTPSTSAGHIIIPVSFQHLPVLGLAVQAAVVSWPATCVFACTISQWEGGDRLRKGYRSQGRGLKVGGRLACKGSPLLHRFSVVSRGWWSNGMIRVIGRYEGRRFPASPFFVSFERSEEVVGGRRRWGEVREVEGEAPA